MTPSNGSARVASSARVRFDVDGSDRSLLEITTDPEEPALAGLLGALVGPGFRAKVDALVPYSDRGASPLLMLLDDVPGAVLVSGYAQLHAGALPTRPLPDQFLDAQVDLSAGWAGDASMIQIIRATGQNPTPLGPVAPELLDATDPIGWHDRPTMAPRSTRHARRLDVIAPAVAGDPYRIDVHFRDSHTDGDGEETVVHEYGVAATLDAAAGTLTDDRGDRARAAVARVPRGRGERDTSRGCADHRPAPPRAARVQGHLDLHTPQRRPAPPGRRRSAGRRAQRAEALLAAGRDDHRLFDDERTVGHKRPAHVDERLLHRGLRRLRRLGDERAHRCQVDVLPEERRGRREAERRGRPVAETSSSPASRSSVASASGSCMENTARTNPPRSGLMCSTIACSMSSNAGWMRPGVLTTTRPGRRQHAAHLGQGCRSVLHEHQSHLAQDDVVGVVAVAASAPASPTCQSMPEPPVPTRFATSIMSGAMSIARHGAGRTDLLGGEPGDDTGAARDVEDAFARLQVGGAEQPGGHRRGDGRHEVALVVLGAGAGEVAVRSSGHAIASFVGSGSDGQGRSIGASAA